MRSIQNIAEMEHELIQYGWLMPRTKHQVKVAPGEFMHGATFYTWMYDAWGDGHGTIDWERFQAERAWPPTRKDKS